MTAGKVRTKSETFTESAKKLRNPGRGFYNIYRFMITDEKADYGRQVWELLQNDESTRLSLIEINLQSYRIGRISREGIDNIRNLFWALRDFDKLLIVRFLYDWDGRNALYEPNTIDIILGHMEQLEGVLQEACRQIFTLQGLFIGNWGEMNATRYAKDKDLLRLAEKLGSVAKGSIYLAVRTPRQWRGITGMQEISEKALAVNEPANRLGLYNDGMLGNESDYGTYVCDTHGQNTEGKKNQGRKAELDFQRQLCRRVPNGGEVINDNSFNDFENAVKDLAAMHVTYLNEGYDRAVLDKWKKAIVREDSCYDGMDGYTYMERHLGYRLLIETAGIYHNRFSNHIKVRVKMKNVGFAPLYAKTHAAVTVCGKEGSRPLSYELRGNLRELTGGTDAGKVLTLKAEIPLKSIPCGEYGIYFSLTYLNTGEPVLLANKQEMGEYGYCLGRIAVGENI